MAIFPPRPLFKDSEIPANENHDEDDVVVTWTAESAAETAEYGRTDSDVSEFYGRRHLGPEFVLKR